MVPVKFPVIGRGWGHQVELDCELGHSGHRVAVKSEWKANRPLNPFFAAENQRWQHWQPTYITTKHTLHRTTCSLITTLKLPSGTIHPIHINKENTKTSCMPE